MELWGFFSQGYKKFLGYMLYRWDFSYSLGVMQNSVEIPVPKVPTPPSASHTKPSNQTNPARHWFLLEIINERLITVSLKLAILPAGLTARNDVALSYMCFLEPWSQSVVLEQAALVSLGSLSQIQNFRFQFRLAESESILLTKYPCNF